MSMASNENEIDMAVLKKKLKTWEYYFSKCHQRKPLKEDIDAAPTDIKDCYKRYNNLKSRDKKPVQPDITPEENRQQVWGEHVSIKAMEKIKTKVEFSASGEMKVVEMANSGDSENRENWAERFSKRWVNNASKNFISRSKLNGDKRPFQPSSSNGSRTEGPKITSTDSHNSTDMSASSPTANFTVVKKSRPRTIPRGWRDMNISESVSNASSKVVGNVYPCDKGDSDSKLPQTLQSRDSESVADKFVHQTKALHNLENHKASRNVENHKSNFDSSSRYSQRPMSTGTPDSMSPSLAQATPKPCNQSANRTNSNLPTAVTKSVPTKNQTNMPVTAKITTKLTAASDVESRSTTGSERKPTTAYSVFKMAQSETASSSVDPYDFDEEDVPLSKIKRRTSKAKVKAVPDTVAKDKSEISTKTVTRKRKAADKEADIVETSSADVPPMKRTATATSNSRATKRNAKNVNDNFVKLNLRKKVFVRGKPGLKGAAYKKQEWKRKMTAKRGTACFKCGEEGHWANKCPGAGQTSAKEEEVFNEDADGFLVNKPAEDYLDDLMLGAYTGEKESSDLSLGSKCPPVFDGSTDSAARRRTITNTLRAVFGFESFRPGQLETVERILEGKSTLVMLSTGAGKSLCYQLPAYLYSKRSASVAVIISPLVSLMEDQVTDLPRGVLGVCLHTNQTETVRAKFMTAVLEGGIQFLLCSPEFMCSNSRANIEFFNKLPPISFACIDEAHCVSEWSHNFRPSYLTVCKILRVKFGVQCFLGLTATATRETVINISKHLMLEDSEAGCIESTILPPNLNLSVSKDQFKEQALLDLLQSPRFRDCQSIIIYCTRREQTERLATIIRTVISEEATSESTAECYHAGLSAAQRRRIQKQFMNGRLRIVVATVAFGMGLDKSDVRGVIHYTLPKGFESYVQEIGRAGRDGEPAECHVFLEPGGTDMAELEKHTYADSIDQSSIRKLLSMIYVPCKCQMLADQVNTLEGASVNSISVCPGHERAVIIQKAIEQLNITEQGIATLVFYLELHNADWIENMSSIYSSCTIKCYGGPSELHNAAKKCIPLGVAMALKKKDCCKIDSRDFAFNILDVANLLNKQSGFIKKELKQLQWTQTAEGKYKRTGMMVEFGDLALRVKVRGDMTEGQLDEVLAYLKERVAAQEKKEISRLNYFYHILNRLAYKDYFMVSEEADGTRSDNLKQQIRDYFLSADPIQGYALPDKTNGGKDEGFIISQVTSFIGVYSHEHEFTGRDVAKILYGIASPNYPPNVWGRVRRFWRSLLGCDFNSIVRIASEQLMRMR